MTSLKNLLRYAKTGVASKDMTSFDKLLALQLAGGGFPVASLSGQPPLAFKSDGTPLFSWSMKGNGQQTGTPAPDNIIIPEMCGVRTVNLLDYTTVKSTSYATATQIPGGISISGQYYVQSRTVNFTIGSSYTMSWTAKTISGTVVNMWRFQYSDNTYSSLASSGESLVAKKEVYALLLYINASSGERGAAELTNIMLNAGSTALPYEPFGWAEKITCAGQTTPVYLGQVSTVRKIRKLVLDGTENWGYSTSGNNARVYLAISAMPESPSLSTHYKHGAIRAYPYLNEYCINSASSIVIGVDKSIVTSAADFKTYLAAQYAAGTPVTVWYVLATPETAIVNEPLAKIGNYADELSSIDAAVTIPTAKGQNTLTVGTDLQPSEMSITGHIKAI